MKYAHSDQNIKMALFNSIWIVDFKERVFQQLQGSVISEE